MQELGSFEVPATRPHVSMKTVPMAGLLVDVYGLDELPDDSTMTLTCLWLLHPRTRDRSQMGDVACRVVDAWKQRQQNGGYHKGLVALAFDMPNHGSRLVSQDANKAWNKGNENHAPDMAGMIRGGSADMSGLMDLVGAYLGREIHGHICLGWSLGGHAAWQAWLGEERLDAAVVIVGCPDFLGLMLDRARKSNLDSGSSPLLGSKFLPHSLVAACATHDPKAILFGLEDVPVPPSRLAASDEARLRRILKRRVRGKMLLACSGSEDALVPYAWSKPLLDLLKDASGSWLRDAGLVVEERLYPGAGHEFSNEMVADAVAFLVNAVAEGPRRGLHPGSRDEEEEE